MFVLGGNPQLMENKIYLKEFGKYSSLNILGMLGLSCYILADTFFVAEGLGSNGLAALNLAIPVYSLINGSGLMLGIGGATKYSISKSQGLSENGSKAFTHSIILGAIFAAVFVTAGIFFSAPLSILLGADGATFEMCKTYLSVLLLFSPAFILNSIILSFVRNDGKPHLSTTAMLFGSIANIIFDYIFIFPLNMGILGAVVATGFSPIISLAIMSSFFIKGENNFKLIKSRFSAALCRKILSLGISSLVNEISSGIVILVFNSIMLRLAGNTGVAAYGVIANTSLVVISIYTGIAQGAQPLISKYYGKSETKSVRIMLKYSIFTSVVISIIIYALIFFFSDGITSVFNSENDAQLQTIASSGMRIYFIGCSLAGINILSAAYFSAVDKARSAAIISISRGLIVITLLAIILSKLFGTTGLWLSFPITEGAVAIWSLWCIIRRKSRGC